MSAFCVPIPIDVIAHVLGVDHERLVEFRDWSEGVIQALNPVPTEAQIAHIERAREALTQYFVETLASRRAAPGDDLISDMTRLQADGLPVSDTELRINLSALLVGGTFVVTTMASLQVARESAHGDSARLVAAMTAAFALGQIIGPLVAGGLFDAGYGFNAVLILGAVLLVLTALLLLCRPRTES